jgi:hypothetical protein
MILLVLPSCNGYRENSFTSFYEKEVHRFFHLKNASELRMDDIPILLMEYGKLLSTWGWDSILVLTLYLVSVPELNHCVGHNFFFYC